jgi:hypothetical protein
MPRLLSSLPVVVLLCAVVLSHGCASLRTLAANRDAVAAVDASSAPLGIQAAENYLQSQQTRGMTLRFAWRF